MYTQKMLPSSSAMSHPVTAARRCSRTAGSRVVYAAAVGARPGYMSFKDSGGSVLFTSGSSRSTPSQDALGSVGPAVGGHPGFMSFTRSGNGAAKTSLSSGAVNFTTGSSRSTPSQDALGAVGPAVGGHPGFMSFTRSGNGAAKASLSSGAVNFAGASAAAKKNVVEQWKSDNESLQQKIQSFGVAGVAAYGLFNTLYYTGAFLFCWLYVAKVPQGLGMAVAARKFVEVLALVWAGSQVTKVPRALGALAFAPLVDRGLGWIKGGLKLESKQKAFWALVAGCLVLASVLFGVVVLAWA